jgi:hypothetical protein
VKGIFRGGDVLSVAAGGSPAGAVPTTGELPAATDNRVVARTLVSVVVHAVMVVLMGMAVAVAPDDFQEIG